MNILLLASHAVAEYDDLRMFHDLGYDVFAPGGYEDPTRSGEGIRPALPQLPYHADLHARCNEVRAAHGEPGWRIDWAKAAIHPDVIDWADVIICHHFPKVWLAGQWDRIRHKRVVWRTCGQSDPETERVMATLDGLQVIRYSPAERRHFEPRGSWAGEDGLIRFGKYPDDYGPWVGDIPAVINITQNLYTRGDACGYPFWRDATAGLARYFEDGPPPPWAIPLGEGSEAIGGLGKLPYAGMLGWLNRARVYLYTGTKPASYTLGLIEAMLSGIPVVTIGAQAFGLPDLFEVATRDDLPVKPRPIVAADAASDDPHEAGRLVRDLLANPDKAMTISRMQRQRAIDLFDVATVGAQWKAFLR